jgi:hypothetical protein
LMKAVHEIEIIISQKRYWHSNHCTLHLKMYFQLER